MKANSEDTARISISKNNFKNVSARIKILCVDINRIPKLDPTKVYINEAPI
jgi:hypothetical protein